MPSPTLRSPVGARAGRNASRFLFQWEAADGLDDLGRLVARTGQVGSFSRGGTVGAATYVDSAGRIGLAGKQQPRFHHQYNPATGLFEPVGLLLERPGTSLVVQSDALTAANGWTVSSATVTAAYATHAGRPFTRVVGAPAGAATIHRAVTLTGDGVKAYSILVCSDGADGTFTGGVYDSVAAAYRARFTITVAAGVVTAVATINGTVRRVVPLGDGVYRVDGVTDSCTAANAHLALAIDGATQTIASIQLSDVQVEDSTFSSSIIPTTTTTVTRSADVLSFAFNAPPQAMTVYLKFLHTWFAANYGPWALGAAGAGSLFFYDVPPYGFFHREGSDVNVTHSISPAAGDTVELRAILNADGSVALGQSVNSASEVMTNTTAALALGSAWASTAMTVGSRDTGVSDCNSWHSCRIAAGVQTMDYMRAG